MVNLAVISIVVWRAVAVFGPQSPTVPASVAYWGDVYRRGELKVGETAPDFCLSVPDGKREVRLSDLRANRPVVLIFGSFTCPHFREHIASLNKVYLTYQDTADFFPVYAREAHPEKGGDYLENEHPEPISAAKSFENAAQKPRRHVLQR